MGKSFGSAMKDKQVGDRSMGQYISDVGTPLATSMQQYGQTQQRPAPVDFSTPQTPQVQPPTSDYLTNYLKRRTPLTGGAIPTQSPSNNSAFYGG